MTKMLQSVFSCLMLCILFAAVGNAAGFKLVAVEEGTRNGHLTSDINGDTIIIGAHAGFGMAKIYVGSGTKWKEQAELTVKPVGGDVERSIPAFGWAVALTGPHELASPDYAVIGAARAGADQSLAGAAYIFVRNRVTNGTNRRNWSARMWRQLTVLDMRSPLTGRLPSLGRPAMMMPVAARVRHISSSATEPNGNSRLSSLRQIYNARTPSEVPF